MVKNSNIKTLKLIIFVFLLPGCSSLFAQSDSLVLGHHIKLLQQYAAKYPLEKVHLHLDRPWYGLGDTIWFKAYTVAGELHQPSKLSGVLYAELINSHDSVSQRVTIPLNNGIGTGDFAIPYTYASGTYRLRAYTNWMRNDSSYFFDQQIIVGGIKSIAGLSALDQTLASTIKPGQKQQTERPDVQFFPEGGYLVNGMRSKVAFKAVSGNGTPLAIQGAVTDNNNIEVATLSTQHEGMGAFPLTPQKGKKYQAKINCANGNYLVVDLPEVKDQGFTVTINNAADSIYIKIAASDNLYKTKTDTAFYLVAQSGGKYYYATSGTLKNQFYIIKVAKSRFPTGTVQFTLFSQSGEPLNERIAFVKNTHLLNLAVKADKESYTPTEKTRLMLETKEENAAAIPGSFSVAVTNETRLPVDELAENTILTDLLLTSELKGHIERPNYYFLNESAQTNADLDLLMLTQGYRQFEWKKILTNSETEAAYQPETGLSLSGQIITPAKKPIAGAKIRLTSVKDFFVADTVSDTSGNFSFTNINLTDTTKLVINAKNASGGNNVLIRIKESTYPAVGETWDNHLDTLDAGSKQPLLTALKKTYITGQQDLFKNVHQLKEVKIESRRNKYFDPVFSDNMKLSANLHGPGNADEVILGEKITAYGGGKLSDLLVGKTFKISFKNAVPYIWGTNGKPMAIFVDGGLIAPTMLDSVDPFDVYSIEVLTRAASTSIYGTSAGSGALIITLKHGSGYKAENTTIDGLITYKFNGFYKAREFYLPKYDTKDPAQVNDGSKTVYWNPDIITDTNGTAAFEYFNADSPGNYRVVIEGIDGYGNLGRMVFKYTVK